jgi:hypothetical protein
MDHHNTAFDLTNNATYDTSVDYHDFIEKRGENSLNSGVAKAHQRIMI